MIDRVASIFPVIHSSHSAHEVLDALGVHGKKVYARCPKSCPVCKSKEFSTLELVGVHSKPLFWECDDCGALHCRKDRDWIEYKIDRLDHLWTNPNDWDEPESENQLN